MSFKGPNKFIGKTISYKQYAQYDIVDAYITIKRKKYKLQQNNLHVSENEDEKFYLYHSYDYLVNDKKFSGRWYNTKFLKSKLQHIKNNTLTIKLDDYEDYNDPGKSCVAIFTIIFTDKAMNKLNKLIS